MSTRIRHCLAEAIDSSKVIYWFIIVGHLALIITGRNFINTVGSAVIGCAAITALFFIANLIDDKTSSRK